jgi:hypothetical protein
MKIRPVGAELFLAERQTDRHDEANSRFSQFCERAFKKIKVFLCTTFSECSLKPSWKSFTAR